MLNKNEYIAGTAESNFKLCVNGGPMAGGVQYEIRRPASQRWIWTPANDLVITSLNYIFCEQTRDSAGNWTRSEFTKNIKITDWTVDTSTVTDMSYMFVGVPYLVEVDLSQFDTSNVTSMKGMFEGCSKFFTSDMFTGFDTSNVTDMSYMFYRSAASTIDVSGFRTPNVTDMSYMFCACSNLTALDVSKWDLSNVTRMNKIFDGCQNLKILTAAENDKLAAALPGSG